MQWWRRLGIVTGSGLRGSVDREFLEQHQVDVDAEAGCVWCGHRSSFDFEHRKSQPVAQRILGSIHLKERLTGNLTSRDRIEGG